MQRRLLNSTQARLFALGVAIVSPLLFFGAIVAFHYSSFETRRSKQLAQQLASNITLIVDGLIERELARLQGLASSSALLAGDIHDAYQEAKRALGTDTDRVIVLRDLDGKQVFNTQVPVGTSLPPAVQLTQAEMEIYRAGRSYVSNVYQNPVSGETRFAVAVPINWQGSNEHLLALTVPTTRIRDALQMATPSGWISAVGDRNGFILARSENHHEVTGKPGVKAYLDKAVGRSGFFQEVNYQGMLLLAGYNRSLLADWLIAANIPWTVVQASLRNSLIIVGTAGALALITSMILAHYVGRRFAESASLLVTQARALQDGRPVLPSVTSLSDLAVVSDALVTASAAIKQREQERDLLTNELNHRVKNTLAIIQSIAVNSLKDATTPRDMRDTLVGRIIALSRAHDVLTERNWEGAELHDLVKALRAVFGHRITFEGPGVWLDKKIALNMSLCLNELATNSAKYGALSNQDGQVTIQWRVPAGSTQPMLFEWREAGGPPVKAPSTEGFGSRLIQTLFADPTSGRASFSYKEDGLRCEINIDPSLFKLVA